MTLADPLLDALAYLFVLSICFRLHSFCYLIAYLDALCHVIPIDQEQNDEPQQQREDDDAVEGIEHQR